MAQVDNLLRDIKALQRRILTLESVFQGKYLQYGPILLDSVLGRVSIYNDSNLTSEIIRLDSDGIRIVALTDAATSLMKFYKTTNQIGGISQIRYTPSDVVTEMLFFSTESTDANRVGFTSLGVFRNGGTRDLALQLGVAYAASAFVRAGITMSVRSATTTFEVQCDNATSGAGWVTLPSRSGGPTDAQATGRPIIYWDTTAVKFKGRTPAGTIVDLN